MTRRGFTLWEMTIVLAIMAIAGTIALPAFVNFGADQPAAPTDKLLALLHDARQLAIARGAMVTLRIDPLTLRYQTDTSTAAGTGVYATGKLDLAASQTLVTDQPRLQFIFTSTGAAFADSADVHGGDRPMWVGVDPWSGVARAEPR
jgi:prepilin-type N-terminal cleavage/methylation domain-containing protein